MKRGATPPVPELEITRRPLGATGEKAGGACMVDHRSCDVDVESSVSVREDATFRERFGGEQRERNSV